MHLLFLLIESLLVDFYSTEMKRTVSSRRLFVVSGLRHAKIVALSFKKKLQNGQAAH